MLVIQRITTKWTKESRGGKWAAVRNAVPEALVLPVFAPTKETIVHEVRFSESSGFRRRGEIKEVETGDDWELGAMRFRRHEGKIRVRFAWSWMTAGAPERWQQQAFTLMPGQWGRLSYNGRFSGSWDGPWWYQKEVFNIALSDTVDRRIFFDGVPDKKASFLARLR